MLEIEHTGNHLDVRACVCEREQTFISGTVLSCSGLFLQIEFDILGITMFSWIKEKNIFCSHQFLRFGTL